MEKIVADFLRRLRVPVPRAECLRAIRSHPDYPALVSVSDALDSLGVDSYVAQFDEQELRDIAFPYLAYLAAPGGGGGELALLTSPAGLAAARARASSRWSGILVQASGLRVPPAAEQRAAYRQERRLALLSRVALAALALLLLQSAWVLPGWAAGSSCLAAVAGLVVSGLLLAKEAGVAPQVVEDFCGSGPRAGCDEVLAADPVRLWGFFTLTEAALTYFLWQVGLLVLAAGPASGLYGLSGLAALGALPVVAYSLYQQYWVVKAWCRLCLLLDAVLLLQAGLSVAAGSAGHLALGTLTLRALLGAGLGLVASGGLVCVLKQAAGRYTEAQAQGLRLAREKNQVAQFVGALLRQPRADTRAFSQELRVGGADAPLELLMVSNPYCAPCQKGHEQLTQLLALYPEQLRARFRLVPSGADAGRSPSTNEYLLQYWLTAVSGQPDEAARTAQLLGEWYAHMSLERFAAAHPVDLTGGQPASAALLAQHYRWKSANHITQTPTYFLNGYRLPANYQLADLKLLLPGLAEYFAAASPVSEREVTTAPSL